LAGREDRRDHQDLGDQLAQAIAAKLGPRAPAFEAKYGDAFSAGTRGLRAARALQDIERIERLAPDRPMAVDFYRSADTPPGRCHAAVYRLWRADCSIGARAGIGEFGLSCHRRALLPSNSALWPTASSTSPCTTWCWSGSMAARSNSRTHAHRLEACFLAVFRGEADKTTASIAWSCRRGAEVARGSPSCAPTAPTCASSSSPWPALPCRYARPACRFGARSHRAVSTFFFDPARRLSLGERKTAARTDPTANRGRARQGGEPR
jgi:hypothetical protein